MSTETPQISREDRAAQLEAIDTIKDLQVEADKSKLTIKPGTSKVDARTLILEAEYKAPEASTTAGGTTPPAATAGTSEVPSKVTTTPPADTPPPAEVEEEIDPLQAQHEDLQARLTEMYDDLVEQIKAAVKTPGAPESADQMRAGAIQFLRQCEATLFEARQFVKTGESIVATNNQQIQSIEKAKEDLNRRSDDYNRMTTGGVKNTDATE